MSDKTIDMCNGPLFKKVFVFALPMMLSGVLQLLFNAVDMVVVGQFAGERALAAVGATSSTINLIVTLFTALSVGVSVVISQNYGAKSYEDVSQALHTAMLLSAIGGIVVGFIGFFVSRPLLILIDTPNDILDMSTLYMRIYFLGMPASLIYNFGASALRAVGNTKQPMYYLMLGGLTNAVLNLVFVLVFHMDVDGVAIATVASQIVSAALVVRRLIVSTDFIKLEIRKLRIYLDKLTFILRIGIPAGVSGCIFALSNMLIQSSLNSFNNENMIAGSTVAGNIEGFIYVAMTAFNHAAITFTGQNIGAGKPHRVKKVLGATTVWVVLVGSVLGLLCILLDTPLLKLYSPEPEVISFGAKRLFIVASTYFLCGIMEVLVGTLRGMGISTITSITTVAGVIGMRLFWIYTVFAKHRDFETLFWSYPVSWIIICIALYVCFLIGYKRLLAEHYIE